jgi:hypothetical protein
MLFEHAWQTTAGGAILRLLRQNHMKLKATTMNYFKTFFLSILLLSGACTTQKVHAVSRQVVIGTMLTLGGGWATVATSYVSPFGGNQDHLQTIAQLSAATCLAGIATLTHKVFSWL